MPRNQEPSSTTPVASRNRGLGRGTAPVLVACLAVALALVFGVLWGLNYQDLRDARDQRVELTGQVEDLEQQVADAQSQQSDLQDQLGDSQRQAEAGLADTNAAKQQLQEREQALEEREGDLDQRETDLAAQQEALTSSEDVNEDSLTADSLTESDGLDGTSEFDRAWLLSSAQDVIEDIRTLDVRMRDGIGVPTPLSMLADSFGWMAEGGVPPGLDEAKYMARLGTLQNFAAEASDVYYDDPMEASARYAVIRKQTGILFTQLNNALGTNLKLP